MDDPGADDAASRYERIVEAMGDGVYVLDTDARFVDVNEYVVDLTGYDRETILGADLSLWHGEAGIAEVEEAIRALLAGEGPDVRTLQTSLETAGGESVPIEVNLTALAGEDGTFSGTVGVLRDVTERRERERGLERYETIVEASGDGVYMLDEDGHYTFMNRTNAELLGYEQEELLGEHVSMVMDEADIEETEALIRDLLRSDRDRDTHEIELITSDGERIATEAHIGLLPAPEGEFRGTVGFVRDITERKERERALERYATIIETTGDPVYTLDTEGHFTYVNEALESFTGYDESELLGEHVSIVMEDEDVERGESLIRELLRSEERTRGTFEMDFTTADGRQIPTENHISLLMGGDGNFLGTTGVVRDITERKERERRLEQQNERLERFASMLGHDLRNPLNAAVGHLQMARKEADDEHLAETENALHRMDDIIQDVLSLAREGQEVVDPATVTLDRCVYAAWDTVETAGSRLTVEDDLGSVVAEESRLRRLLENLFRNAVEHGSTSPRSQAHEDAVEHGSTSPPSQTPEDAVEDGSTEVTVRVGPLAEGFYVEDDGPGIPPADRADVFEYGRSQSDDGTGLGLAIVQTIAEAHGWTVALTEGRDGGARFEFTGVESP